jgi:hypothetical protein
VYWSTFYMLAGVRMTLGRVLVIAGMTVAVTGCGGSSTPSGPHAAIRTATSSSGVATSSSNGAAHTAVTPAIKKLVVSWAGADTPQTVCSLMSYSFKFGVGHGQSPAQCTTWITKAFGPFSKSTGKVISASKIAGQISVLVNIGGHVATLYAVQECGGLKINSIGVLNQHKSPPSCA